MERDLLLLLGMLQIILIIIVPMVIDDIVILVYLGIARLIILLCVLNIVYNLKR